MAHTGVSTVKIPGENTAREIVPYKVAVSNNSDVTVSLPSTLNANAEFLVNKKEQIGIKGFKGFDDSIGLYDGVMEDYGYLEAGEGFGVTDHNDNTIVFNIADRSLYGENASNYYTYNFPQQSGTLGLAVEIQDLRS